MKYIIFSLIIVFTFASLDQPAAVESEEACCYCEVGNFPENQKKFFHTGCEFWLKSQSHCVSKEVVPQNTDYSFFSCPSERLKIGYVGHWSNSQETWNYLQNSILPLFKRKFREIELDNTACRSIDRPEFLLKKILEQNWGNSLRLVVEGNQVDSVGLWEKLLGPSINLKAKVDTEIGKVTYPNCKKFLNRPCMKDVQLSQSGYCQRGDKSFSFRGTSSTMLQEIACCKVEEVGRGEDSTTAVRFLWTDKKNCTVL